MKVARMMAALVIGGMTLGALAVVGAVLSLAVR